MPQTMASNSEEVPELSDQYVALEQNYFFSYKDPDKQLCLSDFQPRHRYSTYPKFVCIFSVFIDFERTLVIFVRQVIPLFWASNDVCPGFQSQCGFPCLHVSLPACKRFLGLTTGMIPAHLLIENMAAQQFFDPHLY